MQSLATACWGTLATLHDMVFQKFKMIGLGPISKIGADVRGQTIIVTGPTSGIGQETAREFLSRGATVILACRSVERGERVKAELVISAQKRGISDPNVEVWPLDVSSLQSVREFAARWESEGRPLHILVNNAGVLDLTGVRRESVDGYELHMATNFLGPFLLTMLLMPALRRGVPSCTVEGGVRIVHVCSQMHETIDGMLVADPFMTQRGSYNYSRAYSQSKLAQVLFNAELRRRLPSTSGIRSVALHPGMVLTQIPRKSLGEVMYRMYQLTMPLVLITPEQGARSSVYCGSAPEVLWQAESSLGYFDSNCEPVLPSKPGRDAEAARWLWRWAAGVVQLPATADLPEV